MRFGVYDGNVVMLLVIYVAGKIEIVVFRCYNEHVVAFAFQFEIGVQYIACQIVLHFSPLNVYAILAKYISWVSS